ncbi:probable cysteine--tRNA ligase, mitochondrial [Malaya genurostris]|uniref:probable cysteine--tRNA ligase, mitochondrial n=1 Tax=Malaya genurostris TaxID=325434 RepID=UPI0026F3A36A|nr:probable cysteine--tRNA ligase, mitochondrial [Malaya genurostris]
MITRLRHARNFCIKSSLHTTPQIYSCKARKKIPLTLHSSNVASTFYTCGPTVYDTAHIGHASCYVRLDILQRILRSHFNQNIVTAMNITDIDDKIIRSAEEQKKPWQEISRHYEEEFWDDLKRLNVRLPDIKMRVTENIPAIIAFISKLLNSGYAYKSTEKSVYFDISRYPQYGKLQNIPSDEIRVEGRKSAADFALWKAAKPNEPYWDSPFGQGRPGWHIECSTMASQIFGNRLNFHAGGMDLRFPHHENEEAQSCCYHQVLDWVDYWIHTGQLHLVGQGSKMSKSLKNTISIRELLDQYSADEFRMFCMLSHYRNAVEYGDETMTVSVNVLKKFQSFFDDCKAYISGVKPAVAIDVSLLHTKLNEADQQLDSYLRNDFNTAGAITCLGDLASEVNKMMNHSSEEIVIFSEVSTVQAIANYIQAKLIMFGFESVDDAKRVVPFNAADNRSIDQLIESFIEIRGTVRNQAILSKDRNLFAICDQMRDHLRDVNVEVKDHGKSSSWRYVKQ